MYELIENGMLILFLALLLVMAVLLGTLAVTEVIRAVANEATTSTQIIEVQVTHLDVTQTYSKSLGTRTYYHMSISTESISAVVEITAAEYATLAIGSTITVEQTIITNTHYPNEIVYKIIKGEH